MENSKTKRRPFFRLNRMIFWKPWKSRAIALMFEPEDFFDITNKEIRSINCIDSKSMISNETIWWSGIMFNKDFPRDNVPVLDTARMWKLQELMNKRFKTKYLSSDYLEQHPIGPISSLKSDALIDFMYYLQNYCPLWEGRYPECKFQLKKSYVPLDEYIYSLQIIEDKSKWIKWIEHLAGKKFEDKVLAKHTISSEDIYSVSFKRSELFHEPFSIFVELENEIIEISTGFIQLYAKESTVDRSKKCL